MLPLIFKNYSKEKYKVIFHQGTGFFARIEQKGSAEIFWAESGPELLDISITNWCSRGCDICYKNSNENGKHMLFSDYKKIASSAAKHNVFQIALGGGNPNQHPHFIDILKYTKEHCNIIPSYSTNGKGLSPPILEATAKYCGAVAVSAYEPYHETIEAVNLLRRYNIKVNIHYILNSDTIKTAINWLKNGNELLTKSDAIIFLNYKPVGKKNNNNSLLLKNSSHIKDFFALIDSKSQKIKVGFDSCMVSGIVKYMHNINDISIEPCEAARFSAYISENLKMYPCSFMHNYYEGEDLNKKSFIDIWQKGTSFIKTRNVLSSSRCKTCSQLTNCLNGCPFLRELDLCE
jgi:radical SAM protein with 4Fe4S-binding SPASM domain